jgi:hypothetical protein
MVMTSEGLIAIDPPKGWVQSDGPGLKFFLPQGVAPQNADASISISSAPVDPKEDNKDLQSFIASDIAGFRKRFKDAVVRSEPSLTLPHFTHPAPVSTLQSGETLEQVVYIADYQRIWILTLSTKNSDAFQRYLPVFREFAQSYRGSIQY